MSARRAPSKSTSASDCIPVSSPALHTAVGKPIRPSGRLGTKPQRSNHSLPRSMKLWHFHQLDGRGPFGNE